MRKEDPLKDSDFVSLPIHGQECGDSSCDCGCADIPRGGEKSPGKVAEPQQCCQPVCGPDTCG